MAHRELIVVQDRDWSSLPDEAREQVRELQRKYVEIWVRALRRVRLDLRAPEARARVHATFGLLNSTPHSAFLEDVEMHGMLMRMGRAALLA